jgi:hypothetical protein
MALKFVQQLLDEKPLIGEVVCGQLGWQGERAQDSARFRQMSVQVMHQLFPYVRIPYPCLKRRFLAAIIGPLSSWSDSIPALTDPWRQLI